MIASKGSTPIALTVAGSDSGGGAGIQADIKAMSATGSYACSVIAALTAQNTQGVTGVMSIPADFIRAQFDAVFSDIPVKAVKIGMLADVPTIEVVADCLKQYQPDFVVLDPVMVATSGDLLLAEDAVSSLIELMLPLANVVTPNLPEAMTLLGKHGQSEPETEEGLLELASGILELGCSSVLVKGGHQTNDESVDYWLNGSVTERFSAKRVETRNTHGTGCTLSSSIASYLAQGNDIKQSIELAKNYISEAIAHSDELYIGEGHGPVNHFYKQAK